MQSKKTPFIIFVALWFLVGCAGVQSRFYKARSGDTWGTIASHYDIPLKELKEANQDIVKLQYGSKIYIPFEENENWNQPTPRREVTNTKIESLENVTTEKLDNTTSSFSVRSEKLDYSSPLVRYVWPVVGRVSSAFGRRHGKFHEGIDIAAPQGMKVRASRSGHVIYSSNRISGYGNLVIIRHADGFSTIYAHLSKRLVRAGQFIAKGTLVGTVGMTGHATSPHLHFEIRKGQLPINPLSFLQGSLYAKVNR